MTIKFALIDDTKMTVLNHQWFGKDEPTDVISFPMQEGDNQTTNSQQPMINQQLLGEIVVDVEEVSRNAQTYNVSFAQELARVMAHGTLHLLGYTDDSEDRRSAMKSIEDAVVEEVGE